MAKASVKENKNIYQQKREALGLSREKASELLETISQDRLVRIEGDSFMPHPDEVLVMAEKYKAPELCNYFCSNQCPIGIQSVPEVRIKELAQIVLGMLSSLNSLNQQKEKLIEITADGLIEPEEIRDFVKIQNELDRISMTIDAMKLWTEQMVASGAIDEDIYRAVKDEL